MACCAVEVPRTFRDLCLARAPDTGGGCKRQQWNRSRLEAHHVSLQAQKFELCLVEKKPTKFGTRTQTCPVGPWIYTTSTPNYTKAQILATSPATEPRLERERQALMRHVDPGGRVFAMRARTPKSFGSGGRSLKSPARGRTHVHRSCEGPDQGEVQAMCHSRIPPQGPIRGRDQRSPSSFEDSLPD